MTINIFEGARRIAMLLAGIATVITVVSIVDEPYISTLYSIDNPNSSFVRMDGSCPSDASNDYFNANTSSGKEIPINLCILAMSFGENGERLIPYKIDEQGMVWGMPSYSSEVSEYKESLQKRFEIPLADEPQITAEITKHYREKIMEGLGYLVLGLAIFGAIVWTIGWIVRGFLGIPIGKDNRQE